MTGRDSVEESKNEAKDKKGVKGWLLVLCISLGIIRTCIGAGFTWYYFDLGLAAAALALSLGAALAVVAAAMLWNGARYAVTAAKVYLIVHTYIVLAILAVLNREYGAYTLEGWIFLVPYYFQTLLGALIWIPYLTLSKRVKNAYQLGEQKRITAIGLLAVAVVILLVPPIILGLVP